METKLVRTISNRPSNSIFEYPDKGVVEIYVIGHDCDVHCDRTLDEY